MEHDEHEMMVEYSEMTAFDFNSKEFQEVQRDIRDCRNVVSNIAWTVNRFINNLKPARNY